MAFLIRLLLVVILIGVGVQLGAHALIGDVLQAAKTEAESSGLSGEQVQEAASSFFGVASASLGTATTLFGTTLEQLNNLPSPWGAAVKGIVLIILGFMVISFLLAVVGLMFRGFRWFCDMVT